MADSSNSRSDLCPFTQSCFPLFILVCLSAFLSCAEISLASARRSRLNVLADDGDRRARLVLDLQEHPGQFFSAIQIGTNALALLGGVVGEAAFSPFFKWCLSFVFTPLNRFTASTSSSPSYSPRFSS